MLSDACPSDGAAAREGLRHLLPCLQMVEFARKGYKDVEPLPFYVNPVSAFGRAAAALLL